MPAIEPSQVASMARSYDAVNRFIADFSPPVCNSVLLQVRLFLFLACYLSLFFSSLRLPAPGLKWHCFCCVLIHLMLIR